MVLITCKCGMEPISLETRTPGKNRGRWYLRCPTGTCKFFKWDESLHSFIKHPTEAYAAQQPLSGRRVPPRFQFRPTNKDAETSLTKTTVKVVFTLLSSELIGIKVQDNLTLNPVIANIEHIQWNKQYNQWTIPASVPFYNMALASLPRETPNIHLDIDLLPPSLLDLIINNTLMKSQARTSMQSDFMSEIEERYINFAESPTKLKSNVQKEAVKLGIERNGKILLGNENGIGLNEQGLALCQVYQDEWPVLVTCPDILCQTWKQEIQFFLGLESNEVCILDPNVSKRDTFSKQLLNKKNKVYHRQRDIITSIKRKGSTIEARLPYKKRMELKISIPEYVSDSSDSSDDDEEEWLKTEFKETSLDELENIHNNNKIKFYITSHEHAAKRRREILAQKFNIILCTDCHLLPDWTKGVAKCIGEILMETKRAILLSPCIRNALPVDTFHFISIIAPKLYPKFELFSKRYCGQKSTVFGVSYKGRVNQAEFLYLMDSNVWYCPLAVQLKPDFPNVVQETILLSSSYKKVIKSAAATKQEEMELTVQDIEEVSEVNKKSVEIKNKETLDYLHYITQTFKRPKIALVYQSTSIYDSISQDFLIPLLKPRNMKFLHIHTNITEEDVDLLCEKYNKSQAMQFIVLDLKAFPPYIACLSSVDLIIFLEEPEENQTVMDEVKLLCQNHDRSGPLLIKYLVQLSQ